jgi:hypothetical protein
MVAGDSDKHNRDQYWASVSPDEIAQEILDKRDKYFQYLEQSGRLDLYRRSWLSYYKPQMTGAQLNPVGQQGELTAACVNDYRNLLTHLETMTLQQRANFEPRAANSDVKSQSQVILATGLLDYYMRIKKLERFIKQGVKDGLMFAEGFVRAEWDANGGDTYGQTATGALVYQGDIKYSNYNPVTCIRDFTRPYYSKGDWVILEDFQNKFELAAKNPDLKEKILDNSIGAIEAARTTILGFFNLDESDQIIVHTLLHPPTPAMPQGRFTQCLDNGTVLMDGPIPYAETHVYRLAPDEQSGTIFGYSVAFDLLPLQEALDLLYSTGITNFSTFGVQNILMPKGHDISTSQLAGGLTVVEYDPKVGKPEALNLTLLPKDYFSMVDLIKSAMQTIAGVDSVTRGDPEASLKSGAALALVAAQSIQFSMNLQQSYAQLVEDLGTGTIELLQTFASVPRVAEIAGKSNRHLMKEFTGQDLDAIHRVAVDMGNPITRTTAGKVNLADAFLERGFVENPDQYIQVVTTGRLEPIIEGKQANLLLMKGENEKLSEGQAQRALITDNHAKHILEHSTVLANPEIRMDPNNPIVGLTLAHIQEHIDFANSPGYQMMAAMLGHQVLTQPAPIQSNDGGTASMLDAQPPVVQQAEGVEQAQMPEPPANAAPEDANTIQEMGA